MEKVKVSKKVAEAFDGLLAAQHWTPGDIVASHVRDKHGWVGDVAVINGMELDILIRAIYIGYEVEQSPEEKVLLFFNRFETNDRERPAIAMVLNLLNIKIEGVNA